MKAIRIRLLSLVFSLVFFFQTHMVFADAALQAQELEGMDASGQSKSFSQYVLQPIHSVMRIAAHRSHSSHSSHRSHSSHSSHSSHQSGSNSVSYTTPRTTSTSVTYSSPSPVITSGTPVQKSVATPITKPTEQNIPVEPVYVLTVPKKLAIFHSMPDSSTIPARSAWKFLCARLEERFTVQLKSSVGSQNKSEYNFSDISKAAQADSYLSGHIIWTSNLYVASLEFGNTKGKKVKINKASESLDMLITSIINTVEEQGDLL
ncbi:MAG: hypothetical protein EOM68_20090 [Spirochaetia bacterium]|nr:hypothetical protein [Spirochaetia bacterium]